MTKEIIRHRKGLYIDDAVWKKFQKQIKPTGQSVSRVIETVMRVATAEESEQVYNIFDSVFEAVKKHEDKE
jgi:hypothetical protein